MTATAHPTIARRTEHTLAVIDTRRRHHETPEPTTIEIIEVGARKNIETIAVGDHPLGGILRTAAEHLARRVAPIRDTLVSTATRVRAKRLLFAVAVICHVDVP